jgi:5-methylcytosine-specific restriction protein A
VAAGVTATTRARVLYRDGKRCQRCLRHLDVAGGDYSLQHRRARGMGGSKRPDTNGPSNLVSLCGSATSPDGCHHHVESHPDEALALGWRLRQNDVPAEIPVLVGGTDWVLFDEAGHRETLPWAVGHSIMLDRQLNPEETP